MRYESVTRPRGPQACGRPVCNGLFPSFQADARAPVLSRAPVRAWASLRSRTAMYPGESPEYVLFGMVIYSPKMFR